MSTVGRLINHLSSPSSHAVLYFHNALPWPDHLAEECKGYIHATRRRVIREINHRYDPHFDSIRHIDRKWRNNRIDSDHAARKRLSGRWGQSTAYITARKGAQKAYAR